MTPIEEQFAILNEEYPAAVLTPLMDGSFTVTIPGVHLPVGWSASVSTVRFVIPVGYPASRPDCFWADNELRLASGATPQNSGANPLPHHSGPLLWFSWHVQSWSPNSDTLTTYMNVIRRRFNETK